MRISDWSSDVCSSDLHRHDLLGHPLRVIVVILGALQRRNRYRTMRDAKFGKPAETVDDFLPGHAGPCTRIVVHCMALANARRRKAIEPFVETTVVIRLRADEVEPARYRFRSEKRQVGKEWV